MNYKIIEEKQNPLFKRREMQILVESPVTPSVKESEKIVSEKSSSPEENIKIKKVDGKFGRTTFVISANVYSSKEEKDRIEPKPKEKKAKLGGK